MKVGFIGIGAQKSATSWLHRVLAENPEITASDPKELNYFTANYDRGCMWYEAHFGAASAGIVGECSPTYFFSADAPQRAHNYNPDLKLIAILRDPVKRCYSNHLHEVRKGHIPPDTSFEAALDTNPAYILQSRYKDNLQSWLSRFDRSQLLVLLSEDIAERPLEAYEQICDHLGVSSSIVPTAVTERHHESIVHRAPGVQRGLRGAGDWLRKRGLGTMVKQVKSLPGLRNLLSMNKRHLKEIVAPMQAHTETILHETFAEDALFVADLLQRDTLPWKTWDAAQARLATGELTSAERKLKDAV